MWVGMSEELSLFLPDLLLVFELYNKTLISLVSNKKKMVKSVFSDFKNRNKTLISNYKIGLKK